MSPSFILLKLISNLQLILPESLGCSLGLCESDRVAVRRQDDALWLQRQEMSEEANLSLYKSHELPEALFKR